MARPKVSRKKPPAPLKPPSAKKRLEEGVFLATTDTIGLVGQCEKLLQRPEKLSLSAEQAEEVHLLLRSSSLGLLTVLSILSGHPDPREVIEKGELP